MHATNETKHRRHCLGQPDVHVMSDSVTSEISRDIFSDVRIYSRKILKMFNSSATNLLCKRLISRNSEIPVPQVKMDAYVCLQIANGIL